jgi:hypothetical protein
MPPLSDPACCVHVREVVRQANLLIRTGARREHAVHSSLLSHCCPPCSALPLLHAASMHVYNNTLTCQMRLHSTQNSHLHMNACRRERVPGQRLHVSRSGHAALRGRVERLQWQRRLLSRVLLLPLRVGWAGLLSASVLGPGRLR